MASKKSLSEFQKLFGVDVDHHVYTKPINKNLKLKYMQWAWVWWYLMNFDPNTTLKFKHFKEYDWHTHNCTGRYVDFNDTANGCYVTAILTVGGKTREQSLPVMNNKNQSVIHPDMMQINKAKQRAFVKCAALFGLGLKIYGMEDTVTYSNNRANYPRRKSSNRSSGYDKPTDKQVGFIKGLLKQTKSDGSKPYQYLYSNRNDLSKRLTYSTASRSIKYLIGLKKNQESQPKSSSDTSHSGKSKNSSAKSKSKSSSKSIGSTGQAKQESLI